MRGLALAALVVLLAVAARGHTWIGSAGPRTYDSANGTWRLVTAPGDDTREPYAELFHRGDRDTWQRTARWTFVSELSPTAAS